MDVRVNASSRDPQGKLGWAPTYTGHRRTKEGGREPYSWTINGVWESECPVSVVTQKSVELVQIVSSLHSLKESTGSTLGADEMPGYLIDAIRISRGETLASEVAQDEAANR